MRIRKQLIALPLHVFLVLSLHGFATVHGQEDETRKFGLTASIQTGQAEILVPIWVGDVTTIAPGFRFNFVENGSTFGTDLIQLGLLIAPRFYIDMPRVAPYFTIRGGVLFNFINDFDDFIDIFLGVGFGGEYFINPKFSLGVEAQLTGFVSDISGSDLIVIRTSAGVHANVYF